MEYDNHPNDDAVVHRACFVCEKYKPTKLWKFRQSYELYVNYWVCRECATKIVDYAMTIRSDVNEPG